ncbi:MAG: hypothetical protein WB471_13720 [Nocardioides sp.]
MSTSTENQSSRASLLAAAGGVVGLALLVGFAVGLPEIVGTDEGAAGPQVGELAPLPEALPGDLLSLLSPDMPTDVVEQSGGAEALTTIVESGADNVAALYGAPTAFGIYAKADGSALVTVTVAPGEPGLFVPDGTPISPEVQGLERSTLVVSEVEDGVCSVVYAQQVAPGQPVDPDEQPGRVHCQLAAEGLLYDVTSQGISVAETVEAGHAVLEEQAAAAS